MFDPPTVQQRAGFFLLTVGLLVFGLLCPSQASAAQAARPANDSQSMSSPSKPEVESLYWRWKAKYLRQGSCAADELYIDSSGDAGEPGDITVSEAHGYGMLALVTMAAVDKHAQRDFDKMVRLLIRHRVSQKIPLMRWRLDAQCASAPQDTSAPDGDLDIIYALLLADARWGKSGTYRYQELAVERINAMMTYVVQDANTPTPIMGLWENISADDRYAGGTRLSDYMMNYFKAFYKATGDARWLALVDHGYQMMMDLQRQQNTGLLPDFAILKDGRATPAPPGYLEGDRDGSFAYNACRIPWRLAADVASHQDARAQVVLYKLTDTLLALSHNEPSRLMDGYRLDGAPIGKQRDRLAFLGPMAVSLTTLAERQAEALLWGHAVFASPYKSQGYYNESLQLLAAMKAGY